MKGVKKSATGLRVTSIGTPHTPPSESVSKSRAQVEEVNDSMVFRKLSQPAASSSGSPFSAKIPGDRDRECQSHSVLTPSKSNLAKRKHGLSQNSVSNVADATKRARKEGYEEDEGQGNDSEWAGTPTDLEAGVRLEEEGASSRREGLSPKIFEESDEGDPHAHWEKSVEAFRGTKMKPSADVIKLQSELSDACLGAGLVRFCGIGDVHGIVQLSDDPNTRGNPRPIIPTHVEALYEILQRRGAKRDHEAPAILVAPRALIEPNCLQEMQGRNSRDITAALPFIKLVRPQAAREDVLENRLWLRRVNGARLGNA
ncbi:hypothetical protein CTheo_9094 [Ceratobasidium theobromae]|uniref:Uncharacterized protein n=1 Tax=Ceratobasidium theobromae TaxID=1582974 RepID=A0A5N5Q7U7_9AGAM|nr:hypothetical protein CTheo_9094 [Ceratobasidium theobromae]